MSPDPSLDHAFAMERAVRAYYASVGIPVIPCHEFCGRNPHETKAPLIWWIDPEHGRRHLVLPDLILLPAFAAVEIKTQGYAPLLRMANCRTTGMDAFHYESYRYFQAMTGKPVMLAFVHLQENEIRGGPLDLIEAMKTDRINIRRRMVYWEYDALPEFFPGVSLAELRRVALACDLSKDRYTTTDDAAVQRYLDDVAAQNAAKHKATWISEDDIVLDF